MSNMKKAAAAASVLTVSTGFAASFALASYAVWGKRYSLKETEKIEYEKFPEVRDLFTPDNEYIIYGDEGCKLHACYYSAKEKSSKFIILTHGYTYTRHGCLKYMPMFLKRGYNCVIYDLRGHGANKRTPCTFGIKEAKDLIHVIYDTYERYGKDIYLGLHGESLGSATTLTALKYKPNARFIIEDCGFADLMNVEKSALRGMKLPGFLAYPGSLVNRMTYGYSFTKVRPVDDVKGNKIPLLVIHGEADDLIDPENAKRIYDASEGIKRIETFPGAAHAQSYEKDPERYEKTVNEFLDSING